MASMTTGKSNRSSHQFWSAAALSYTLPDSKQNFFARLIGGTTVDADRFSAYRLGGFLPLIAEYPLTLPGYYYQEFSARQFVLLNASYLLPIAPNQRWNLDFNAATAVIDYLPGTGQPGNSVSGVGGGILYRAPSDKFRFIASYGYGFNAIRDGERGANSITFLLQIDLDKPHGDGFSSTQPDAVARLELAAGPVKKFCFRRAVRQSFQPVARRCWNWQTRCVNNGTQYVFAVRRCLMIFGKRIFRPSVSAKNCAETARICNSLVKIGAHSRD